jgi:hypothetical protein
MFSRTRRGWAAACLIGFGTLFVAFSLGDLLRPLFWPSSWPDYTTLPSPDPTTGFGGVDPEIAADMYHAIVLYHVVHVTVFGGVIGWLQARVLQTPQVHAVKWVILTVLGFDSIFVFELFRPGMVSGGYPGPAEPLLIGVVGGGLAGLFQWLYLRRRNINTTKWLALWIAGLCTGAALSALVLTLLGFLGPFMRGALSPSALFVVGQFVFYLIYGLTVGATAGLMSGRAMIEALPLASEPSAD